MAIKKTTLIVFAYLLVNNCKSKTSEYSFYTKFDELNRKSVLFLTKNNIIIDSLRDIGSYYGKDSIIKRNNNQWDYFYNGRCGTGCSVIYYMSLSPVKNRIKVKLNILYKSKESDYKSLNTWTKEYIPYFSSKENYISKIVKENGIMKNKISNRINYDEKNNFYYNRTYEYNNSICKGIKIDSLKYILVNENNWKFYDSITKKTSDLN